MTNVTNTSNTLNNIDPTLLRDMDAQGQGAPVNLAPGQGTQPTQIPQDPMTAAVHQARQLQNGGASTQTTPQGIPQGSRLLPGTQQVSRVAPTTGRPLRQGQNADGTFQKAEYWLNIGRVLQLHMEDQNGNVTVVPNFLSLPSGVPLERQEKQPVTSSNIEFARMNAGKNAMIDQLWEVARTLRPGEFRDLTLTVRLSRVNAEKPDLSYPENNPWIVAEPLVAT